MENAFYFEMIKYSRTALTIEINSSKTSITRTENVDSYWVISQQFICPYHEWIFAKCYDANNNFIIQIAYRNGQPFTGTDTNVVEISTRYLGTFNIE